MLEVIFGRSTNFTEPYSEIRNTKLNCALWLFKQSFILRNPMQFLLFSYFLFLDMTAWKLIIFDLQEQARLREFCVQNSLSVPTQVFVECGVQNPAPPPPRPNKKCKFSESYDFGFDLVQNTPPSPQNENLVRTWDFEF